MTRSGGTHWSSVWPAFILCLLCLGLAGGLSGQSMPPEFSPGATAEVQRLQGVLAYPDNNVGDTTVSAKTGQGPNGRCTVTYTITNRNTGQSLSTPVNAPYDCKDIDVKLFRDPETSLVYVYIYVKPKPPEPPPSILNPFPFGFHIIPPQAFNPTGTVTPSIRTEELHKQPAADGPIASGASAAAAAVAAPPVVLDLPMAPPFSTGSDLRGVGGCDPSQNYTLIRVNHWGDSVTRFDGCPLTVTTTIPVTMGALEAQFTPDNKTIIVTSYYQAITFIDATTNKIAYTLTTPSDVYPSGLAISSDGKWAYVTSFIDINPALLVIDVVNRSILARLPLPLKFPNSVFISPDDAAAYVMFPLTNAVIVYDLLTQSATYALQLQSPHDLVFNRTGTRAYLTTGLGPGAVQIIDTSTYQIIDSIPLDDYPGAINITPDDRQLVVEAYGMTNIWTINLATKQVYSFDTGLPGPGLVILQ
jgi:DNA-binding beta-propeller fold protein YncE